MAAKLPVCCARREGQLTRARADLARMARKASGRPESDRLRRMVLDRKKDVEAAKAMVLDHEAEHAGEAVPA